MSQDRVMLLIDADNVSIDIMEQAVQLLHKQHGGVHVRRAYCTAESAMKHQLAFKRMGIKPMVNLAAGKNSTDIALAVDAIDLVLAERPDVVVIASSDSDFAPLVQRLREKGCEVRGIGQLGKTGQETQDVYDDFTVLEHRKSSDAPDTRRSPAARKPVAAKRTAGQSPASTSAAARTPAARKAPAARKTAARKTAAAPASAAEAAVEDAVDPAQALEAQVAAAFADVMAEGDPGEAGNTADLADIPETAAAAAGADVTDTPAPVQPARGDAAPRQAKPARKRAVRKSVDERVAASAAQAAQAATDAASASAVDLGSDAGTDADTDTDTNAGADADAPVALAGAPAEAPAAASRRKRNSDSGGNSGSSIQGKSNSSGNGNTARATLDAVLQCLPELQAGQSLALNTAVERLRKAQLLGKSSSSLKLFSSWPERFELVPKDRPSVVRLRG